MNIRGRLIVVLLGMALAGTACGTSGATRREPAPLSDANRDRGARGPAPLPVGRPLGPEAEPDNVERRFGFAEARARRDNREQAARRARKQVDHVPTPPPPSKTDGSPQP